MADERQAHLGLPGASALLKARRLREQRQSLNASRTSLARLAAALFPPKIDKRLRQEEHNWTTGAQGEQNLASSLARSCPKVTMMHDRRAHGSRGNIDHIAIAPSGVYVIDCKRYKGKIEVAQPLRGKAKLKLDGATLRDSSTAWTRRSVRSALAEIAHDVPVHGCLCFVAPEGYLADVHLPIIWTLKINGYPLYYPRRLAKRLNQPGPLTPDQALSLVAELSERLPQAP